MSTKHRVSESEYDELAHSYAEGPISADEVVGDPLASSTVLRRGRPVGRRAQGRTPVRSLRLPPDMESKIVELAEAEGVGGSEMIRRAIADYLAQHSR